KPPHSESGADAVPGRPTSSSEITAAQTRRHGARGAHASFHAAAEARARTGGPVQAHRADPARAGRDQAGAGEARRQDLVRTRIAGPRRSGLLTQLIA